LSRIFLVRHGEVEGNSGERLTFSGWHDVALTPRGELQAQAVAQRLKRENIGAVYSSDLQRAQRTAEAIATQHDLPVQTDAALREVNYGDWAGLSEAELLADWNTLWQQRLADPVNVAAPGGESLSDLWRRVEPAWQSIAARHSGEGHGEEERDAVVVGHNGSIRALVCHLLGMPPAHYRRVRITNCGLTCVQIVKSGNITKPPLIEFVNETCHLNGI
jgi:broad specificity phosphatase PhoE